MQRWLNYTTGTKGLIHLTSQHNRNEWFEAGKLKIKTHTYNEANSQLDKASIDLEDIPSLGTFTAFVEVFYTGQRLQKWRNWITYISCPGGQ